MQLRHPVARWVAPERVGNGEDASSAGDAISARFATLNARTVTLASRIFGTRTAMTNSNFSLKAEYSAPFPPSSLYKNLRHRDEYNKRFLPSHGTKEARGRRVGRQCYRWSRCYGCRQWSDIFPLSHSLATMTRRLLVMVSFRTRFLRAIQLHSESIIKNRFDTVPLTKRALARYERNNETVIPQQNFGTIRDLCYISVDRSTCPWSNQNP